MGGMLTTIRDLSRYVGAFLDAWPPRDGPEAGPLTRASLREMQQPWRPSGMRVVLDKSTSATHLTSTSYGYGLTVTQTCQDPRDRRAQRRTSRIRLAHAVAARLRGRHHSLR